MTATSRSLPRRVGAANLSRYPVRLLGAATAACARLTDGGDREAMHDFRVAVRRLRTWLRVVQVANGDTRALRRGLRKLAHATNRTRDLEIETQWLAARRSGCAASERIALAALLRERRRELRAAAAQNRRQLATQWPPLLKMARTSMLRVVRRDYKRALETAIETLIKALRKTSPRGADPDIHRARIGAKRVRYLLEPCRECGSTVAETLAELVQIQDDFGRYHDRTVLMHALRGVARSAAKEGDVTRVRALAMRLRRVARAEQRELFQRRIRDHLRASIGALARRLRDAANVVQRGCA